MHTGSKCWIERIDVNTDVHFRVSDTFLQGVNDAFNSNFVDVSGFDYLESASLIISDVSFGAHHWRTYTSVD